MKEPRTIALMLRDIRDVAKDYEWVERTNFYSWGNAEKSVGCNYCHGSKDKGHDEDCYLQELLQEIEGYLLVEEDLNKESK